MNGLFGDLACLNRANFRPSTGGRCEIRILICPTAFKGSIGAAAAARAMARGARRGRPDAEVRLLPLSDGGPGLLDALRMATEDPEGEAPVVRMPVEDPLGRSVEGRLLLIPRAAVAESADSCGLHHLAPGERRPLKTGTEGVGDLIRAAAETGVRTLFLGMGGSASSDGGAGAARRLGWRFLDGDDRPLGRGGGPLQRLATVEPPPDDGGGEPSGRWGSREEGRPQLVALADVRNPLLGPRGAARTFAPQKGADRSQVQQLEVGLSRLAALSPHPELRARPGSGAAGGLAFGCAAFLGGTILPGTSWVLERVAFSDRLAEADLVVTGEGAYDRTTGMGKVVEAVLGRARRAGVPVVLACGRIDGPVPEEVRAGDGGGGVLSPKGLADLVTDLVGGGS